MGITDQGLPFATPDPFERPAPAPDLEDGLHQSKLFTTIDEAAAKDAELRLLKASHDWRVEVETTLLPLEQRREDEHVLARREADRRKADFARRETLRNERVEAWQRYVLPVGSSAKRLGSYVIPAAVAVEAPLAFVAGYALLGGVTTGDRLIDGPLKVAPLALAVGVATVCCLATFFAGRLASAYFEHRRALKIHTRNTTTGETR